MVRHGRRPPTERQVTEGRHANALVWRPWPYWSAATPGHGLPRRCESNAVPSRGSAASGNTMKSTGEISIAPLRRDFGRSRHDTGGTRSAAGASAKRPQGRRDRLTPPGSFRLQQPSPRQSVPNLVSAPLTKQTVPRHVRRSIPSRDGNGWFAWTVYCCGRRSMIPDLVLPTHRQRLPGFPVKMGKRGAIPR